MSLGAQPCLHTSRWLSAQGRGLLGASDCARLALQLLLGLARVQPPVDEAGCLLQPLPVVLRVLGSARCLPHIAQVRTPLLPAPHLSLPDGPKHCR